jgi:hypothetical protein
LDYKIVLFPIVREKIASIKSYIALNFSKELGDKVADDIISGISILKIFPEAGFDADLKYHIFDPRHKTRGITIMKKYIALYHIVEEDKKVVVTKLFSVKEDPIKLFR